MKCPRCGLEMDKGVCPGCGYAKPAPTPSSKSDDSSGLGLKRLINLVTVLSVSLFLGYLVINIGMMLSSVEMILSNVNRDVIFIVLPIPIGIFEVTGDAFHLYYLFLVSAVFISFVAIFYTGIKDMLSYFKEVLAGEFGKIKEEESFDSPILRLACIFTALLFISYTYLFILQLVGITPTAPTIEETPVYIYSLTRAVVWEEIVVRVAFIGLPMAIYAFAKGKGTFKRYILGGFDFETRTESRVSVLLVVGSSAIFALAHLPGWDLFKMFPTFIAGLAFGYLFIKDGLHSAILLHFFWNFMSVPDRLVEIENFNLYLSLMILFWMVVGAYYTYHYLKRLNEWMNESPKRERKRESIHDDSQTYTAGVTIGYICPNCRFDRAIYTEEGKLKCKRCGAKTTPQSEYAQQQTGKMNINREWPPS